MVGLTRCCCAQSRTEGSRVHIVLEDSQLVQRLGESGDVPAATTHLLAESVSGLAIRYFGEERDGRGARWREAWSGAEGRLPDLVGVSFRFPDGDLRRWPELIVRPRAAAQ